MSTPGSLPRSARSGAGLPAVAFPRSPAGRDPGPPPGRAAPAHPHPADPLRDPGVAGPGRAVWWGCSSSTPPCSRRASRPAAWRSRRAPSPPASRPCGWSSTTSATRSGWPSRHSGWAWCPARQPGVPQPLGRLGRRRPDGGHPRERPADHGAPPRKPRGARRPTRSCTRKSPTRASRGPVAADPRRRPDDGREADRDRNRDR